MVDNGASLDAVLLALADPTRRAILKRLAKGESTVNEIAKPYAMSLAGVSKHLQVLERAKLVVKRKDGRIHHCRLNAKPMASVAKLLIEYKQFWESRFDELEKFLAEDMRQPHQEGWGGCLDNLEALTAL